MKLKLLESGSHPPQDNMDEDRRRLSTLRRSDAPLLRFYDWSVPSATYGHFAKPEALFRVDQLEALGLTIAKRPTGGGAIFHTSDLTFSVFLPADHPRYCVNTMDCYHLINSAVKAAIADLVDRTALLEEESPCPEPTCLNFCMAKPTKFDLLIHGKKVGGAAQRRTKEGLLHQGSLYIHPVSANLVTQALVHGPTVLAAMQRESQPLGTQEGVREQIFKCLSEALD